MEKKHPERIKHDRVALAVFGIFLVFAASYILSPSKPTLSAEDIVNGVTVPKEMKEMADQMKKQEVIEVTKGVYVAVGYGLGNVMLLEGPDGAVIIDTTETEKSATNALKALRKYNKQPIKGIIYTHHHADHVFGASVFVQEAIGDVDIWAHESFMEEVEQGMMAIEILQLRAFRQFGVALPNKISAGIGDALKSEGKRMLSNIGLILPNKVFYGPSQDIQLAGLKLKLVHIPGETPDQIGIWMDEKKVFCSGDNIYKAFPNLYAIRGTTPRNVRHWFKSIDVIRAFKPNFLVPMHGVPLSGSDVIQETLMIYRDAIQFIHDQTIRFMNKDYLPEDIVKEITLPPKLANHPYLYQIYGNVFWSVRAVYELYLGWFNGNPSELVNMGSVEKATKMIELAGGRDQILQSAAEALDEGDARWSLELASHVFLLNPNDHEARTIRLQSLRKLASEQTSSNGRNYFLTKALEDHNLVKMKTSSEQREVYLKKVALPFLFQNFQARLKPETCIDTEFTYVFNFTDTNELYSWRFRNGILEIVPGADTNYEAMMIISTTLWREIIANIRSPMAAYLSGDLVIEGSVTAFQNFRSYFDIDF